MSTIHTATTQAVCSVRLESDQWRLTLEGKTDSLIRMALNVKQLVQILKFGQLQDDSKSEPYRTIKSGNKRTAPAPTGSKKRAKTKEPLRQATPYALGERKKVHVYSHIFELSYTRSGEDDNILGTSRRFVDDERAKTAGWLQEEAELLEVLSAKCHGATSPHTFDLGHVTIGGHGNVVYIFHGSRPEAMDDEHYYLRHLLALPTVRFSDDVSLGNLLSTCHEFQCSDRVSMSATANLVFLPNTPAPKLPIHINVMISVSFIVPAIFLPMAFHAALVSSFEDRRRRLLSYIFCPCTNINNNDHERDKTGEVSIRHFYAILEPAPPVPSPIADNALQPDGLRAILLPFQRRSVKVG